MDLEEAYSDQDEINYDVLPAGPPGLACHENPVDDSIYGDELLAHKDDSSLLMAFLNVNGLCREKWKEKNKTLLSYLYKKEFDIVGLIEINLHWPSLPPQDSREERTDSTWQTKHDSIAYNK